MKTDQSRVELLRMFVETLGLRAAVLISPSMSGHYAVPFLMKHSDKLRGFVPIAPVGTRTFTPLQYQAIQVSFLFPLRVLWGLCVFLNWGAASYR